MPRPRRFDIHTGGDSAGQVGNLEFERRIDAVAVDLAGREKGHDVPRFAHDGLVVDVENPGLQLHLPRQTKYPCARAGADDHCLWRCGEADPHRGIVERLGKLVVDRHRQLLDFDRWASYVCDRDGVAWQAARARWPVGTRGVDDGGEEQRQPEFLHTLVVAEWSLEVLTRVLNCSEGARAQAEEWPARIITALRRGLCRDLREVRWRPAIRPTAPRCSHGVR